LVDVWLPYGKTEICARIPTENLQDNIGVRERTGVENPVNEIRRAIRNPFGLERLADKVKMGNKVAVAMNILDMKMAETVAALLIEEITQSGLKSSDITVIFAYDPFRLGKNEYVAQLKNEISSLGVNVVIHNPLSEDTYVGETDSGIKIHLNRAFVESDIRVVFSVIEPNPYTLYRWGGYEIALGLSNIKTIEGILMLALNFDNISENIHKSIIEVSKKTEDNFSISIVRNMRGEVIRAFAGDMEKTFYEEIKIADAIYKAQAEKRADIVFVSPGGAPFDATIFDSCGCLENALKITKRDGKIVLVAECSEGYGNQEFYRAISRFKNDLSSLEKLLRKRFSIGGFVSYRFLRALKRANIMMVSAVPDYYVSGIQGLKIFRTATEALKYALEETGKKARVSVIPYGNHVILSVKEAE